MVVSFIVFKGRFGTSTGMCGNYLCLISQTAQHLSNTYGDRAVKIGKMSTLTGKRWPIVGRKLHEDYPYTEAEVSRRTPTPRQR